MAAQDSHVIELAAVTQNLPMTSEIEEEDSSPAQHGGFFATQPEIEEEVPVRAQEEPNYNATLHNPTQPQNQRTHELKESMRSHLEEHRSTDGYYLNRERCPTIRMVPDSIRKEKEGAYTPKLVSIGPFHRGRAELMQVEPLKWSYLHDIIQRSPETNSVDRYIDAVWEKVGEARKQYLGDLSHISDDDFVEMLVLDGCFLLEFLLKRAKGSVGSPWSDFRWNLTFLRHDLLLLENQIPFFVIQLLFRNTDNVPRPQNAAPLTLMNFAMHYLFKERADKISNPNSDQVHHLLHLYHWGEVELLKSNRNQASQWIIMHCLCYPVKVFWKWVSAVFFFLLSILLMWKIPSLPSLVNKNKHRDEEKYPRAVPTARKLRDAGVKFKRKKQSKEQEYCCLDVSFNEEDGKIEMPLLSIQNTTVSYLRNLIAFEQCKVVDKKDQYFTSFAVFMDQVIDTSEDVAILSDDKVIESKLGCDEDVATLFNGICSGVSLDYDKHYLKDLFRQVNDYSQSDRNQWRADLVRRYFNSPWAKISFFAAFLLLGSTVLQTVYTVRQSYNKS